MATAVQRTELLSIDQFLDIDFGQQRAELDDGVIRMMAGGTVRHAQVQGNIFGTLFVKLRGSGCRPYGPDMGLRTGDKSFRLPDIAVYCGDHAEPEKDRLRMFDDPKLVVEVLSDSTRDYDHQVKVDEYRNLPSVDAVLLVDPSSERLRLVRRTRPNGWRDEWLEPDEDVVLPTLGITLTRAEIFARD